MKEGISKIHFHFLVPRFYLPNRTQLKTFLLKELKRRGKKTEAINYIFCNDEYLLEINQQYLNHNTLTDIITFELSPQGQPLVSDVFISVERVKENAGKYANTFTREIHRVIFHGVLHLMGYKDKDERQVVEMRQLEDEFLMTYFISRGTHHKKKH